MLLKKVITYFVLRELLASTIRLFFSIVKRDLNVRSSEYAAVVIIFYQPCVSVMLHILYVQFINEFPPKT